MQPRHELIPALQNYNNCPQQAQRVKDATGTSKQTEESTPLDDSTGRTLEETRASQQQMWEDLQTQREQQEKTKIRQIHAGNMQRIEADAEATVEQAKAFAVNEANRLKHEAYQVFQAEEQRLAIQLQTEKAAATTAAEEKARVEANAHKDDVAETDHATPEVEVKRGK